MRISVVIPCWRDRRAAAGEGVIVSDSLAQRHGLTLGETVDIPAPYGGIRLPIAGIIVDYTDQQGAILIDRRLYLDRWHDDSVSDFRVYLAAGASLEDVRQRLQLLLDTFTVDKFEPESIGEGPDYCRSVVVGHYTHRRTREKIRLRIRFRAWFRDGLIACMNEHHDAAYVEAFQRFVFHLENAVRGA